MSFTRLLITAVVIENRSVAHVAAQYGVSQSWLFELVARYKAEGEAAFEPRSRRPHGVPTTTPTETVDLILELREKLTATGDVGRLGLLLRLRDDQPVPGQVARDRRPGHHGGVVVLEVPLDGVGAGVQADSRIHAHRHSY
jgi:hypothetical protein